MEFMTRMRGIWIEIDFILLLATKKESKRNKHTNNLKKKNAKTITGRSTTDQTVIYSII